MDFQQVVQQRRMVRAFREEPLVREVVERILANGNRAPSAGFSQGYAFLVLEEAAERARCWQAITTADHQPVHEEAAAPLLVVPLSGLPEVLHVTLGQPWSAPVAGRLVVIWTG